MLNGHFAFVSFTLYGDSRRALHDLHCLESFSVSLAIVFRFLHGSGVYLLGGLLCNISALSAQLICHF